MMIIDVIFIPAVFSPAHEKSKAWATAWMQEKPNLPAKGEVFLLDIPFYRTRLS